jgi:hypothetical protein
MINVAMVGYAEFPHSGIRNDLVVWMPKDFEGENGVHYCHVGIVDDQGADFGKMLDGVVRSGADVLHYANFRDPYHRRKFDRPFLTSLKVLKPELPILLTSAHPEAEKLAERVDAAFLNVPFKLDEYVSALRELAERQ